MPGAGLRDKLPGRWAGGVEGDRGSGFRVEGI